MDCSSVSLVIFQFRELRTMAIDELDFYFPPTEKGEQKCASKYEVCVIQLWCWYIALLQKYSALSVWVICVWTLWFCPLSFSFSPFLNLKRLFLPASSQGGNDFWAIVCEMFLYLGVLVSSAQKWDVVHQFHEHSLSCLNLILPQGGMWWQERSF